MIASEVEKHVRELYTHNSFMNLCGIEIISIECGKARVGLTIDAAKHTNLNDKLHGGLLVTLMDNATGIAAASIGKRVVTVSTTVDFLKTAGIGDTVEAEAVVQYIDSSNVNMMMNVYNMTTGNLIATGMSCMLAIEDFPGIPLKW